MVMEYVTGVLVFILGVATVGAAYLGVLGLMGTSRMTRCDRCGHIRLMPSSESRPACVRCRRERLSHPFLTVGHVSSIYRRHAGARH
jgi:hypothetical protein